MSGSLLAVLVLAAVIAVLLLMNQRSTSREEKRELARLRALVDKLREIAYDHRELDSALATIVIDEIKNSERKGLEP